MRKNLFLAGLLVLVACVPSEAEAVDYTSAAVIESDTAIYSRLLINSCLSKFKANTSYTGFQTYNLDGSVATAITVNTTAHKKSKIDYISPIQKIF